MRHHLIRVVLGALVLAWALIPPAAAQTERIRSFESEVVVAADGSLTVTETIHVTIAGEAIRHGIYRDFPTLYEGPWGLSSGVGFEVIEVRLDGRPEPWWTERMDNGVRVWIGSADRYAPHGKHAYTLVYRTDRQISFLDGTDELAWNVTGNGWDFPIDRAEAVIVPPPGTRILETWAYTGDFGSTARDAQAGIEADGSARFVTTAPLGRYEGLTVAVTWPAGIVPRPTGTEQALALAWGNPGLVIGTLGLVATIAFFLVAWHRVGRDPEKGTIIPLFEAPQGLSPVATGYVWHGGIGGRFGRDEAFAAAIASLATKGIVAIDEIEDGFALQRMKEPPADLPTGEAAVMRALFRGAQDRVELTGTYKPSVGNALSDLRSAVSGEYAGVYRRHNRGTWLVGVLLAAGSAVACLLLGSGEEAAVVVIFFAIFGAAFGFFGWLALRMVWRQILDVLRGQVTKAVPALLLTVFAAMFMSPALFAGRELLSFVPVPQAVLVVALAVTCIVFLHLLEAPTHAGRALLDRIEGYRLYLSVAEADRMAWSAREPRMTPALFERHLPYAMALGVADAWAERFAALAPEAARAAPSWYRGSRSWRGPTGLASTLSGGLGGKISSSATAPSSRSGGSSFSSGGGSSGGGGGGGGGGGW